MRARFRIEDVEQARVGEGQAEAAVLIADGTIYVAATPEQAFDLMIALAEWCTRMLPPSLRWQTAFRVLYYGRHAQAGDRRRRGPWNDMTSASAMLEVVRDVLGPDAWTKVRDAAARRMMGR